MKSIATINFKGGVGKTTVTWLLAKYIAEKMNKKVLVVDIDSQMSFTLAQHEEGNGSSHKEFEQWYNQHIHEQKTLLSTIKLYEKAKEDNCKFSISSMVYKMSENLHFIPSTVDLYWFEFDINDRERIKSFMKSFFWNLEHSTNLNYDYVFFDCPPNFTTLTYSILSCVNMILIPINSDNFAARGMNLLLDGLLKRIKPWTNPEIAVFMSKAKTFRDFYLTSESKMYLNEAKKIKSIYEQQGIKIDVLDCFIPESFNINSVISKSPFPKEYEEYFYNLWEGISNNKIKL